MRNDRLNAWWVVKGIVAMTTVSAPGVWAVMWVFTGDPPLDVVLVWSVSIALLIIWVDAAGINATSRRADLESRVLRPGHRNGDQQ